MPLGLRRDIDLAPLTLWCAAVLMVAAIVHIASILIMPRLAPDDAFTRLARGTPLNRLAVLPRPGPMPDSIPFRDPALASAICRYDVREGGLRIGAALSDAAFLAVSFHSRSGIPFYALTDGAGHEGRIDLMLLLPDQIEKAEAAESDDVAVHEIRVPAPEPEGFVVFDVLPRIGGYAAARQILNSADCQIEAKL